MPAPVKRYEFTAEQGSEIRRLYAEGKGYRKIAAELNAPGKSVLRYLGDVGVLREPCRAGNPRMAESPRAKEAAKARAALAELLPLPDPVEPQEWRSAGLCFTEGHDPNLWFPEVGDRHNKADTTRPICHRCPALFDCAAYALSDHTLEGMWGGLTHNERRVILRAQRAEETA